MPMFPIPFLTAFFLMFLLARLAMLANTRPSSLAFVTIGCWTLQSVLLGVMWGITPLPPLLLASVATALPLLTWLTLEDLSGRAEPRRTRQTLAVGGGLIAAMIAAALTDHSVVTDLLSTSQYLFFGIRLIRQGTSEDLEWTDRCALHLVLPTRRAYVVAGTILLASAAVDIAVELDIDFNEKRLASWLVGYANLALLGIALAIFFGPAGSRRREQGLGTLPTSQATPHALAIPETAPQVPRPIYPVYREILEKLDREMNDTYLYRSESLSLNKIASRIRVQSRQISAAVNSLCGISVPQYINTYRVREACRMLEETDTPITEIVFAVGFTTKSNFNREFLRITNLSPSAWRARARGPAAGLEGGCTRQSYRDINPTAVLAADAALQPQ